MPNQVAFFDPLANPSGSFNTQLPNGIGTIHIINDTIVTLNFAINNFASMTTTVPAGKTTNIAMCPPYVTVYWNTQTKLVTNTKTISSHVIVMAYGSGEAVPAETATSRQVNPTNVGFSFNGTFFPSAANTQIVVGLVNPVLNTFNATVYQLKYVCRGESTNPVTSWISGFEGFLGTITPTNRFIGGPASSMFAEFSTNFPGFGPTNVLEQAVVGGNEYDFVSFPDQIVLPPGFELLLNVAIANTTSEIQTSWYWTETLL